MAKGRGPGRKTTHPYWKIGREKQGRFDIQPETKFPRLANFEIENCTPPIETTPIKAFSLCAENPANLPRLKARISPGVSGGPERK